MVRNVTTIPREHLARTLGMLLTEGFQKHPEAYLRLVQGGEAAFLRHCRASDQQQLSQDDYRAIYQKLVRRAKRLGLVPL